MPTSPRKVASWRVDGFANCRGEAGKDGHPSDSVTAGDPGPSATLSNRAPLWDAGGLDIFAEWQNGGTELRWRSTTAANQGREVAVFSRRLGTPGAPALVLVHGFPTSSIDYFALANELASEFDIHVLDFPGYGLSDKPPEPYAYSLYDDARLLVHAITQVWKLTEYRMLTHDRGSSVGMIAVGHVGGSGPARSTRRSHPDQCQHLPPAVEPDRVPDGAARPHDGAGNGGRDHTGDAGGRHGSQHLHPAAEPRGPRNRRAGKVLRAQRRGPRAARHDPVPARARRRRNRLAGSAFREPRQHHGGVGAARQRRTAAGPQPRVADVPEEQARNQPLLGGARRRPLSAVRRARAAGRDRAPHGPGRGHRAADAGQLNPTVPCWSIEALRSHTECPAGRTLELECPAGRTLELECPAGRTLGRASPRD